MADNIQTVCPHCGAINRVAGARLSEAPNCGRCHQPLLNGVVQPVNDAGFQRLLSKEQLPLVVDFWASWCGPCQGFAPIFERVAKDYAQRARFVKVDTEKAVATAQQWQIRSIPTLMIFQGGQLKAQQSGAMPDPQFKQWLTAQGI